MSLWQKFLRAEYQTRPMQLVRRAWRTLNGSYSRTQLAVRLPWGFPITVDPRESIGRSIAVLEMLDLPVTEGIWRLVDDGAMCVDVGANIGFMTSVMAARLRTAGHIHCFEPVPELADSLAAHVAVWQQQTGATFSVHRLALTEKAGAQTLCLPPGFEQNRGLAMLASSARKTELTTGARTLRVECDRLDALFRDHPHVDLVKIDVEGCERQVLEGAAELLRSGRIRDVILEEYAPPRTAASLAFLREHHYDLWRITRSYS